MRDSSASPTSHLGWVSTPSAFPAVPSPMIWTGMAITSLPVLSGWQYATLISPVFVVLLLTRISGVNLLEESADKKWGHLDNYQNYKKNTAVLVPFIF